MSNKHNIFMGIDVSKHSLDISIDNRHYKIKNTKTEIKNFLKTKIIKKIDLTLCVLESTGGYEKLVITLLNESNIRVHRAHPNKVYAFAKAAGHFAKTDKLDSKLLERYASFVQEEEINLIELDSKLIILQDLRSVQKGLERELHANQCKIKMASGQAASYLNKHINFIKKQLANIDKELEKLIDQDEELKRKREILISYKGVGKKIANNLLIELPELGNLTKGAVAALTGVAPKTNESGKKIGKGRVSGGRFFVRKSLYMAALVAAFYNDKMKQKYQELLAVGKPSKVALTAIMRKIIICLNSMIKNNNFYAF